MENWGDKVRQGVAKWLYFAVDLGAFLSIVPDCALAPAARPAQLRWLNYRNFFPSRGDMARQGGAC
jgi:hypothetical protein